VFDLTDVRFIKRIVVGTDDPSRIKTPAEIEDAQALLNRCLSERPAGRVIGVEKSFVVLNIGEHQVVLQWLCYHVGFERRPHWLPEA
jgi:hypothetical protein